MKIAIVTEDGRTISQHFGRAPYYLVVSVEDGQVTGQELRDKVGHRQFAQEHHDHEHHDHGHGHGHDHDHAADPRGHGFDAHSQDKHARMIAAITDCEAVIVRGMGRGAYVAMQDAKIRPIVTDLADATAAVRAYLDGTLVDHSERLH